MHTSGAEGSLNLEKPLNRQRFHLEMVQVLIRHGDRTPAMFIPNMDNGNYDYDWSSRLCQRFSSTNIPKFLYHVLITPFSNSRNIRDAKKLISSDIVQFLIKERNETGSDSLEKGNIQKLKKVEEELLLPFFRDKSLIFRRIADINWPLRDKKRYLSSTIKAVKNRPLQLKNWKYLFHAIYRILWVVLISKSRQRNSF